MDPRDPRRIAYEQQQWLRHDWHRFCTPDDARRMGLVHPDTRKAERRRAWEAEAAAARADAQFKADQAEILRLRLRMADLRFERALIGLRRKYSESQPRVPAGNPDGGQWASGGASSRLAQALPPLLRPLPFLAKPPIAPRPVIRPFQDWPTDPTKSPAPGFNWRGQPGSSPGDGKGSFYNKELDESLRPISNIPDMSHIGIGSGRTVLDIVCIPMEEWN